MSAPGKARGNRVRQFPKPQRGVPMVIALGTPRWGFVFRYLPKTQDFVLG